MKARSQLLYRTRFPRPSEFGPFAVLIYDRVLLKKVPGFRAWVKKFPVAFAVTAGESLKSLTSFEEFIARLVDKTAAFPVSSLTIVGAGGGSVGDFAGFVASVFKRGVALVHLPTTWLAALDSAHGGKTALNVGGAKNQIGTFYPASRVYLVREALIAQPEARTREAFGELAKIALIDGEGPGRAWVRRLERSRLRGGALLWKFLPEAVAAKYRVVNRDPLEKKRIRQVLNLGHTLGHVIEAHHSLAHGEAVGQGLLFALEWSRSKGWLAPAEHRWITDWLDRQFGLISRAGELGAIPQSAARALLNRDKKRDRAGTVLFIFLNRPGRTRIESVTLGELLDEARRQGWVRG